MTDTTTTSIIEKYQETVKDIMSFRLRIIAFLGGLLHLTFTLYDKKIYPSQYIFLTRIRLISCIFMFIAYGATYIPWCRKKIRPLVAIIFIISALFLCLMIQGTNGVASRYYEGLNLMILTMLIANGFDWKLNVRSCVAVLITYTLCVLFSSYPFDFFQYSYNMYFMISTTIFVGLMTKFFGEQHFQAFSRNEALIQNRKQIAHLYSLADEQAKTDPLTKIYSRRYINELIAKKIESSERLRRSFYLVMMDLDEFKTINDTYGHTFGDQVLQVVASVLTKNVREGTCVARYGGDEFMLLFEHSETEEFQKQLEDLCTAVNQTEVNAYAISVQILASFGAVKFSPYHDYDAKRLLELADRALFEVKQKQGTKIKLIEEI